MTQKSSKRECPKCGSNLDGGSIWQTGFDFALEGRHYEQGGAPTDDKKVAEEMADKYAEAYGATRTKGNWGREIGIYDIEKDRTVRLECPDCKHQWDR